MPDMISESVVIILDASRSMHRSDYSPNRLEACKQGILNFVSSRVENEAAMGGTTTFSFILIKNDPKMIFDIFDGAKFDEFLEVLNKIKCGGVNFLGEALGMAIKVLIEDIRTNGARVPRILLFSDGKYKNTQIDPMKMAKLAQQLTMHIDTIRVGDVEHFNIMKRLSENTEGKYYYSNNVQGILSASTDLAQSNFEAPGSSYQKGKIEISNAVLKKIAKPLLTEGEMNKGSNDQKEVLARLRGTKEYNKCSICFQSDDPISKTGFRISGRYCPNCAQPMHLSCASMWAKSQDKTGDGTVFRCVHCLYLLKLPASIQTAVRMHSESKKRGVKQKEVQTFSVKPIIAKKLGDIALYSACPVCNGIFEEDETVIKCSNPSCKAIYHMNHFEQLPNHICKLCGNKLVKILFEE
ncbi:VWA domain-containing protein [Promethearchaeum syntrophicum]|uniref:VWA domain-containing protein n=1 Tax=Promethearchaeum syntrophicum TaxID=2594042 RepID=A0A5B9D929_9ARCH|nr:VWA domain-containing protein [Candidatus Prometheoarchaeum syntrophicum]QEE15106.1 von Willebrand factor type A domain protein [Candidatus Prometheoarchaeum syntrophicum]